MPEMKGFGRLFFGHLRLQEGTPFVHRAPSTEIDYPFRAGPSLILRLWPGHGIVVGVWTEYLDEDTAMMRGLNARVEDLFDEHGALLSHYGRAPDDRWWRDLDRENQGSRRADPEIREGRYRGECDAGDAGLDRGGDE